MTDIRSQSVMLPIPSCSMGQLYGIVTLKPFRPLPMAQRRLRLTGWWHVADEPAAGKRRSNLPLLFLSSIFWTTTLCLPNCLPAFDALPTASAPPRVSPGLWCWIYLDRFDSCPSQRVVRSPSGRRPVHALPRRPERGCPPGGRGLTAFLEGTQPQPAGHIIRPLPLRPQGILPLSINAEYR